LANVPEKFIYLYIYLLELFINLWGIFIGTKHFIIHFQNLRSLKQAMHNILNLMNHLSDFIILT